MMPVVRSKRASQQLREITAYLAMYSTEAAERFLEDLQAAER
jgi:plasmid stabilization system protein ParE